MGRIIIFTGKGGVGKTTTAAAHALKAAQQGKRTLIISTDTAHNLGDLFEQKVQKEPCKVIENLDAVEINHNYEMEKHYGTIVEAFKKMIRSEGTKEAFEDVVAFPGMEELFSLLKIAEIYEKGIYDVIIVDCAPTGETLSLLKFPELLSWYMEKLFPIGKLALRVLRPIGKVAFKVELPNTAALNDIEKLYLKLADLERLLKDREICSIRLVAIPEKMVVEETKRNYMYLNLYNFNVDGLYINRIMTDEIKNSFFDEWKKLQQQYINELEKAFSHIPNYKMKWYETDLKGISALQQVVKNVLDTEDILEIHNKENYEVFEKTKTGYVLKISLPFVNKKEFDLFEAPKEIMIKVGNFKRNILLPEVVRRCSVSKAKLEDHILYIYFENQSKGGEENE